MSAPSFCLLCPLSSLSFYSLIPKSPFLPLLLPAHISHFPGASFKTRGPCSLILLRNTLWIAHLHSFSHPFIFSTPPGTGLGPVGNPVSLEINLTSPVSQALPAGCVRLHLSPLLCLMYTCVCMYACHVGRNYSGNEAKGFLILLRASCTLLQAWSMPAALRTNTCHLSSFLSLSHIPPVHVV